MRADKLRPFAAAQELHRGDVRSVMITGDNAMCGLYIARQAGMISPKAKVRHRFRKRAPFLDG